MKKVGILIGKFAFNPNLGVAQALSEPLKKLLIME